MNTEATYKEIYKDPFGNVLSTAGNGKNYVVRSNQHTATNINFVSSDITDGVSEETLVAILLDRFSHLSTMASREKLLIILNLVNISSMLNMDRIE